MEFPDLGAHCFVKSCNVLDFLPMKCDACQSIFCKDHFLYSKHSCEKAYLKDTQVPVCPLCNQPVPSKRGQLPDIAVGEHIDNECQDDRAGQARRKADPNRCRLKGCKQRNLVPVLCSECKINFCLRHRHPQDHQCDPREAKIPKTLDTSRTGQRKITDFITSSINRATNWRGNPSPNSVSSLHGNLSEDEALARALHASLNSPSTMVPSNPSGYTPTTQEEEDEMLAQAIAESKQDSSNHHHKDKCNVS